MIPYGHQSIDDGDIAAVVRVLKSDWLTQGPHIEAFEDALAAKVEARYAVAFANGTAALHAAAATAGLEPGLVGVTSPLTFVASANCLRYVGAEAKGVDIDPATLNLDPAQVPAEVDALVAVHYGGLPIDLRKLRSRPSVVIEDAAHALGAMTPQGPVGNCALSDMCTFSFHPVKHITTGEGGAVTTNSPDLAEALRTFRTHGIVRRPDHPGWYYEVEGLGFNYRMTDVQAALGMSQLNKLEEFIERRRTLAARYSSLLSDSPVGLPPVEPPGFFHSYHLFPVQVADRRRIYDGLRAKGIGVQVHYVPLYRHPVFNEWDADAFPNTENAYRGLLSLPLFPGLTELQQEYVVESLLALL